jgi:hypothetical protein
MGRISKRPKGGSGRSNRERKTPKNVFFGRKKEVTGVEVSSTPAVEVIEAENNVAAVEVSSTPATGSPVPVVVPQEAQRPVLPARNIDGTASTVNVLPHYQLLPVFIPSILMPSKLTEGTT